MIKHFLSFIVLLSAYYPGAVPGAVCVSEKEATAFEFHFDSGANWQLCWHIDPRAGLVISDVHYGAPAEQPRQLLDSAALAQVLFQYNEDTSANHLLSDPGFGGEQFVSATIHNCIDGELLVGSNGAQVCRRFRDLNQLTKVRRTRPLRRHEVSLHARAVVGTHHFEQVWRFSEDGELSPSLLFSGTINRYTSDSRYGVELDDSGLHASAAAVLVNWRLDFNIDGTANNDLVDEIEFLPFENNKRVLSATPLTTEASRMVNAETFRGWRIRDAETSSGDSELTRVGYYLDPQGAGYRYVNASQPWTSFDFFVTRKAACEKLAAANKRDGCAESLDGFINEDSLQNADIVAWYSVSRQFTPQLHDVPAIASREIGFKLIPFDWSARSPFESLIATEGNGTGE